MTEEYILGIVSKIEESKKDKIHPSHAVFKEISNKVQDDLKKMLRNLVKDKKLEYGNTLNDYYFKIIDK